MPGIEQREVLAAILGPLSLTFPLVFDRRLWNQIFIYLSQFGDAQGTTAAGMEPRAGAGLAWGRHPAQVTPWEDEGAPERWRGFVSCATRRPCPAPTHHALRQLRPRLPSTPEASSDSCALEGGLWAP